MFQRMWPGTWGTCRFASAMCPHNSCGRNGCMRVFGVRGPAHGALAVLLQPRVHTTHVEGMVACECSECVPICKVFKTNRALTFICCRKLQEVPRTDQPQILLTD